MDLPSPFWFRSQTSSWSQNKAMAGSDEAAPACFGTEPGPRNHCHEPPAGSGPGNLCSCRTGQTGPAHCHSARPSIKGPRSLLSPGSHPTAPCTLAPSCLKVCPGMTGETSEPPNDLPPLIFLGITQLFWNPFGEVKVDGSSRWSDENGGLNHFP